MTTAFDAAIDTLFLDPNISGEATYTPVAGAALTIRVIPSREDGIASPFGAQIVLPTGSFDVKVSDVAAPQKGDTIAYGGETYRVQGEPRRIDSQRLVWRLPAEPI